MIKFKCNKEPLVVAREVADLLRDWYDEDWNERHPNRKVTEPGEPWKVCFEDERWNMGTTNNFKLHKMGDDLFSFNDRYHPVKRTEWLKAKMVGLGYVLV